MLSHHHSFKHLSHLAYLAHQPCFHITVSPVLVSHFFLELCDVFIHCFLAILQVPHAVMKLFVLTLVSARASPTAHDPGFTQGTHMDRIVFLLEDAMA